VADDQPKPGWAPGHRRLQPGFISTGWTTRAECLGAPEEWFFPKNNMYEQAKRVCGMCKVTDECLEYAVHFDIRYGLWGGQSPWERGCGEEEEEG
jgi:WhiB family redox-sensing transcriptional regulator